MTARRRSRVKRGGSRHCSKQQRRNAPDWIRRLALAADQFIVRRANARPHGDRRLSVVQRLGTRHDDRAPGLTLATGRYDVAASVLRTFARFVSEGMLPNRFPDAGEAPEYNTVDATLWYFHALDQYLAASGDRKLVAELYPTLLEIVEAHLRGTRYRIHADSDGLLYAGAPGVQLTWMDAKVGDWVVTPRIGKPVEINALWYRALVVMQSFAAIAGDALAERRFAALAGNVAARVPAALWSAERGWLADVIDGPDGARRSRAAAESDLRRVARPRAARARAGARRRRRVRAQALDAARPAQPRAERARLRRALRRRTARARRARITRAPFGAGCSGRSRSRTGTSIAMRPRRGSGSTASRRT